MIRKFIVRFLSAISVDAKFISYFISVLFSIMALFFIIYTFGKLPEINYYRDKIQTSEMSIVAAQSESLYNALLGVEKDMFYVKNMLDFDEFINADQEHYDESYQNLLFNLSEFIQVNSNFSQIRYINKFGMEIIRINQNSNGVEIVDPLKLQDKSNRYYFINTMKLKEGQVYQSPLDLNIENGLIDEPFNPMIRFSTKVYNSNKEEMGIIIINYSAKQILETVEALGNNSSGQSYLLNSDSYYLTNHEYVFDFMFNHASKHNFSNDYPSIWEAINKNYTDHQVKQAFTSTGFVTYAEIALTPSSNHESHWYILTQIEKSISSYSTNQNTIQLLMIDFLKLWPYFIFIMIVSLAIAFLLYERRLSYEKMSHMAQIDSLTGVFNRSAGLELISFSLDYCLANKLDYSICFIDLNDLKKTNDSLGHEAGDEYLKDTVYLLKETFRDSDYIVRMGGDEFLIGVSSEASLVEEKWVEVNHLCHTHKNAYFPSIIFTLSHGVSSLKGDHCSNLDELIKIADSKMYTEKRKIKTRKVKG